MSTDTDLPGAVPSGPLPADLTDIPLSTLQTLAAPSPAASPDAIQVLIAELRDYKQSENAQRIKATVETMVLAFNEIETALGTLPTLGPNQSIPVFQSGLWTPIDTSGAGLVFTGAQGGFTLIGNLCFARASLTYPATASGLNASIGGLPFPISNSGQAAAAFAFQNRSAASVAATGFGVANTTNMEFNVTATGALMTNAQLSGAQCIFQYIYPLTFP